MEPRRPGKLEALTALASTLVAVWYILPPEEQRWMKLRAVRGLHRLSDRAARRAGRGGMRDELAGRDFQRYGLAYRLSQARDRLAAALEDMRP